MIHLHGFVLSHVFPSVHRGFLASASMSVFLEPEVQQVPTASEIEPFVRTSELDIAALPGGKISEDISNFDSLEQHGPDEDIATSVVAKDWLQQLVLVAPSYSSI